MPLNQLQKYHTLVNLCFYYKNTWLVQMSEAATGCVLWRKVFLKISQPSGNSFHGTTPDGCFWNADIADTDTSDPSLITVRMEYVFAFYLLFNTDIVDFWPKFLYSNLI